ncbi:hypothetical protein CB1_007889005 [Camelus ferus]|nr:hypothetical protein CB1_007889005 [Camelus ferus]
MCSECHNRVIFKQLLQAKALQFLQIDSCRLGSVNENLAVLLMAKKFDGKGAASPPVAHLRFPLEFAILTVS